MSTYYGGGILFSDELYHHGIKGQKWHVRRYQNEDGTWTTEGKVRYGRSHGHDDGFKKKSVIGRVVKKIPGKIGKYIVKEGILLVIPIASPVAKAAIAVGIDAAPALFELYKDYKLQKSDFE